MGMNNVVIFGAGQTGRGFINHLLMKSGYRATFFEKNKNIVESLASGEYKIFSIDGSVASIKNYEIFLPEEHTVKKILDSASICFISVGLNNIPEVSVTLQKALVGRRKPLWIITAENGQNPSKPLQAIAQEGLPVSIAEGIVFCTTLAKGRDIISEDLEWFPYTQGVFSSKLPFVGFVEADVPLLMKRKLYTYNCISAAIAYFGAYKGYLDYYSAATDPEIADFIEKLRKEIDTPLAEHFLISIEEQMDFSLRAVLKFQNKNIPDSIERNAHDVRRKLGPSERLLGPLLLLLEKKHDVSYLEECIVYALIYGISREKMSDTEAKNLLLDIPEENRNNILRKVYEYNV